jgi:TolA-binding protein
MAAAAEALANLATTNSTSTSVLQELTNQLSALTSKVEQLTTQNSELKATVQTLKSNATPTTIAIAAIAATMEITVGRMVTRLVTSTTVDCRNPAPGHCKEATRANTMGGSQANKPKN